MIINKIINFKISNLVIIMKFVPIYNTISQESISRLQRYILTSNTMCVMTGAGISTESGLL